MKIRKLILGSIVLGIAAIAAVLILCELRRDSLAADHAEAPALAHDAGADIGDVYLFLDPNDTNRVIMIMTLHGFVAPQENVNLGFFDPEVKHRFELERTGDAKVDDVIDVTFAPRTSTTTGQIATIQLPNRHKFTAPATPPSLSSSSPTPILTTNDDGVIFFAGVVDDPFFFDIPAFNRFVKSVLSGQPNGDTNFNRGRDSFAGYNNLAIALSVPADLVRPTAKGTNVNHVLGMAGRTQRRSEHFDKNGDVKASGSFRNVDRMGIPAVNTALIPFAKKNAYNAATGVDDAKGKFADDILATLAALGTSDQYQQILAGVAVAKGDFLRLDLTVPNSGSGRGLPAGGVPDAFPNGRRLHDDVIDIILTLIANGNQLGDNVDANDVTFSPTFPFLAPSQQPRENIAPGVVLTDDNTRN
jgi:hypothetical protein